MSQRTVVAFAADYETVIVTTGDDGTRTESRELQRLYRDARGRTRLEGTVTTDQGTLRFAWLMDLDKQRGVVLDLDAGEPLKERPGPVDDSAACQVPLGEPAPTTWEDLGEAQIEGLAAHGTRTTSGSTVTEVWTALQIDQPPLLVKETEPSRETTRRLFNIRFGEPEPMLFTALETPRNG